MNNNPLQPSPRLYIGYQNMKQYLDFSKEADRQEAEAMEARARFAWEQAQLEKLKKEIELDLLFHCGYSEKTLKEADERENKAFRITKRELQFFKKATYSEYLNKFLGEDTEAAREYHTESYFEDLRQTVLKTYPHELKLIIQKQCIIATAQYYQKCNGRRDGNNLYPVKVPKHLPIFTDKKLFYYYISH